MLPFKGKISKSFDDTYFILKSIKKPMAPILVISSLKNLSYKALHYRIHNWKSAVGFNKLVQTRIMREKNIKSMSVLEKFYKFCA